MAKIGYVGLGIMGSGVVKRLLQAGHTVVGYNRTKSKAEPLLEMGMKWADSPRAVAEVSDIVFSMVTNTKAVQAITEGPDSILAGLKAGKIYIDMSTISPTHSQKLAARVAEETGAIMLDGPVSGSHITLEQGKLSFMIGGDEAAFERVKPVLLDIGPKATHVGRNGLALAMKIAVNLSLAVQMLAFSEGVLLAEKSGISREKAVEVFSHSAIASPMIVYRGPLVIEHPEGDAWFDCSMMQKDMNLAIELGQKVGVPLPTTSLTNDYLTAAQAMGLGHYDFSIVFDVLARMSDVKTGRE